MAGVQCMCIFMYLCIMYVCICIVNLDYSAVSVVHFVYVTIPDKSIKMFMALICPEMHSSTFKVSFNNYHITIYLCSVNSSKQWSKPFSNSCWLPVSACLYLSSCLPLKQTQWAIVISQYQSLDYKWLLYTHYTIIKFPHEIISVHVVERRHEILSYMRWITKNL